MKAMIQRGRGPEKGGGGGGASKRAAIAKSPRDKCQRPPSRVPEERPMLSAVAPVAQLRHGRRLAAAQARRPRNGQAATLRTPDRAARPTNPRCRCGAAPFSEPIRSDPACAATKQKNGRTTLLYSPRENAAEWAEPNSTQQNAEKNEVSGTNNIRFVPWQGKEGAE
ncbi:unnamed protein product [Prorocentrum cordatum]|uniref:Uncharacterized protein n=1 Tax=Prorocentrum cordatum TaxID=2364126 RepID=A0ABN9Q8S1_9DINO|nr:unnamed protein product [Polarella glacialis]